MNREKVFRDTKNWYLDRSGYASQKMVNFAIQHAGNRVLDIGCATGEYIRRLNECGFECVGVEANPEYVEAAKNKGLEVYNMDARHLAFPDKSFDTALLFEVLEHIDDPAEVLKEARRVSRKNLLITVPDCTGFDKLSQIGLTFEHMLEKDHVNFFAKEDLEALLSKHFERFRVVEAEPIVIKAGPTLICSRWLRRSICFLMRLKLAGPKVRFGLGVYYRLYGIVDVA
jgi:ubiquinone/menaquinone biosynthesis C-methylase UbiE